MVVKVLPQVEMTRHWCMYFVEADIVHAVHFEAAHEAMVVVAVRLRPHSSMKSFEATLPIVARLV